MKRWHCSLLTIPARWGLPKAPLPCVFGGHPNMRQVLWSQIIRFTASFASNVPLPAEILQPLANCFWMVPMIIPVPAMP